MIIRIVTLKFDERDVDTFRQIFAKSQPRILQFEGCTRVDLLQDVSNPGTMLTYSHWESEDYLNAYRKSEFFGSVWPNTKALLIDKPEVISVVQLSE